MKSAFRLVLGSLIAASFVATFSVTVSPAFASGKALLQSKAKQKEVEDDEKETKSLKATKPTKPSAKISPVDAMKLAEGKTGGKAKIATFEFEDGNWIYGVVVVKAHKLMEVEIDATSGKVGDVESFTADSEAKEFRAELAKMETEG